MIKLDNEQQCAVDSNDKRIVVLAAAGSGKSSTLLARINRLLSSDVAPSEILALTFTNAAAQEMKSRFKKLNTISQLPMFCTFHGFCYSLIVRDSSIRRLIGYSNIPSVAEQSDIDRIWTETKQLLSIRLSDDVLNRKEPAIGQKAKFELELFWKRFNSKLRQNNLITFDIMCYEICKLFENNDPATVQYKMQYKHIFIDEFQDTDPKQWKFAKSFTDSSIFVVGDAKQAIYAFRNADVDIIKQLTKDPSWTTIKLVHNYRSTRQICEFSNAIHDFWGDTPYNLAMVSDRDGLEVIERDGFMNDLESDGFGRRYESTKPQEIVRENLFTILDDNDGSKTVAILCRSNAEVSDVSNLLKQYNIAYNTKRSPKSQEQYLRAAMDSDYLINWLSDSLSSAQYNEYTKLRLMDDTYTTEQGFYELYKERFSKQFDKILNIRAILASEADPAIKYMNVAKLLRIKANTNGISCSSNEEIVNKLIEAVTSVKECNLYVGTIHSVKGLEFDIVHLIGVDGRRFPLISEEQHNIYYVGCTRAKEKLVVWNDSSI